MSTRTLPEGLVTHSGAITDEISRISSIDLADLFHLWRVYSTHKHVINDDIGTRLENFFWRILSKDSIHQTITGPTIARLFEHISEGSDFLRTTPTQSPRASRWLAGYGTGNTSSPRAHRPGSTDSESCVGASDTEVRHLPPSLSPQPLKPGAALPPPILKSARGEARRENKKTARIAPSPPELIEKTPSPPIAAREPPISSTPHIPGAPESSMRGARRKKTGFVASSNGGSNRRRPMAIRRKSLQTPSGTKQATAPSPESDQSQNEGLSADSASDSTPSSGLLGLAGRVPSAPVLMQTGQYHSHILRNEMHQLSTSGSRRVGGSSTFLSGTTAAMRDQEVHSPVEQNVHPRFEVQRRQGQFAAFSSQLMTTKAAVTVSSVSTAPALGTVCLGEGSSVSPCGKARQVAIIDTTVPLELEVGPGLAEDTVVGHPASLSRPRSQLTVMLDSDRRSKESKPSHRKALS